MPTCPKCGQAITVDNTKLVHHVMQHYVYADGKPYGVVNSNEDSFFLADENGNPTKTELFVAEKCEKILAIRAEAAKKAAELATTASKPEKK